MRWALRLLVGLVLSSGLGQRTALAQAAHTQPVHTHTVQAGDTLSGVARAHGTTVAELIRLNGLSGSTIRVGQALKLPGSPAQFTAHESAEGETLNSLAAHYGVSATLIQGANPALGTLAPDEALTPDTLLFIPPGEGLVVRLGPDVTLLSAAFEHGLTPSQIGSLPRLPEAVFIPAEVLAALPRPAAPAPQDAPGQHQRQQLELLAAAATHLARYQPPQQTFVWPLAGPLSSSYGQRLVSVAGNTFHTGIDIVAAQGTPVAAARTGVVTRAGWGNVYGYVVYLDHGDGSETRYAHLSIIAATPGQAVAQGSVIGYVGSTGASTGPHLHFELRFGGRTVDPLGYLQ